MKTQLSVLLVLVLTIFITNTSNAQEIEDLAKLKFQKIKNKRAMKGLHKEYMGKIVFSTERIPFKKANASSFIDTYNLGDELYIREYWDKTMEMAYKNEFSGKAWDNAALLYIVSIDGVKSTEHIEYRLSSQPAVITWFTSWANLYSNKSETRDYIYNKVLKKALAQASNIQEGATQTLTIETYIYNGANKQKGKLLAKGSINIKQNSSVLRDLKGYYVTNTNYPDCFPKPVQQNIDLEAKLLEATKDKGWKETHKYVVLRYKNFKIVRHPISGIIEGRKMGATVGGSLDGKCWYQNFTYFQAYDGYDYKGSWELQSVGEKIIIPCSCINQ